MPRRPAVHQSAVRHLCWGPGPCSAALPGSNTGTSRQISTGTAMSSLTILWGTWRHTALFPPATCHLWGVKDGTEMFNITGQEAHGWYRFVPTRHMPSMECKNWHKRAIKIQQSGARGAARALGARTAGTRARWPCRCRACRRWPPRWAARAARPRSGACRSGWAPRTARRWPRPSAPTRRPPPRPHLQSFPTMLWCGLAQGVPLGKVPQSYSRCPRFGAQAGTDTLAMQRNTGPLCNAGALEICWRRSPVRRGAEHKCGRQHMADRLGSSLRFTQYLKLNLAKEAHWRSAQRRWARMRTPAPGRPACAGRPGPGSRPPTPAAAAARGAAAAQQPAQPPRARPLPCAAQPRHTAIKAMVLWH